MNIHSFLRIALACSMCTLYVCVCVRVSSERTWHPASDVFVSER